MSDERRLPFECTGAMAPLQNDFRKVNFDQSAAPSEIQVSVLSKEQASNLFSKFIADKRIPFAAPQNGCFARATAMAEIAEQDKLCLGKVFVRGVLNAKSNLSGVSWVPWDYHVAPVAYVKELSTDGIESTTLMVFDPALFTRPVPLPEWKKRVSVDAPNRFGEIRSLKLGTRFQDSIDDPIYKGQWGKNQLEEARVTNAEYVKKQFSHDSFFVPTSVTGTN